MNQNQADLQEIEVSLETAKKSVDTFKAFERLRLNKDFQLIIEKGYFEDEAIRLVAAKSSPLSVEDQVEVDKDIIGVGRLRQYFIAITQHGRAQENAIKSFEDEQAAILAEEAAE